MRRIHRQPFKGLGQFFRDHSLTLIIYSLVGNTALAQLFYNSAGVILPNEDWRSHYLILSAVLSMIAFSLFELRVVRQLKELLGKHKEVRANLPRWEIPAHFITLAVISLYNIYSLFLLNAAIWPALHLPGQQQVKEAAVALPELPGIWKYLTHAIFYSLILFLAAVVVERTKSAEELAAEEDEALHREMIAGSNDYYRDLIAKGGRNVVKARQVLSGPQAAEKQAQLLAALEGEEVVVVLTVAPPVRSVVPDRVVADADDDELVPVASNGDIPGRMRFTPERADTIERWALGEEN